MRTTFEVRKQLEEAAAVSGRSLAQEAEFRIERSFLDQQLMVDALELAYGRGLAGILLVLGETMKATGTHAGFSSTFTLEGSQEWWHDPYAFDQAMKGAAFALSTFRPNGEIKLPRAAEMKGGPPGLDFRSVFENLGEMCARGILDEVATDEPITTTALERAPRLRRALGGLVDRVRRFVEKQQ
jgi:hypothetical protein